jgi:pimeloyl-ACP methyl ester carboxylesterase
VEIPPFMAYQPTAEAIKNARPPIVAAASRASRNPTSPHHFLYQAAAWLASDAGTDLAEIPGGHMVYLTDPTAVAEHLRPLLQTLS